SPDGSTLATADDFSVRLWDAAPAQAIAADLAEDRELEDQRTAFERDERARAQQRQAALAADFHQAGFIQDWLILAPVPLKEGETGAAGVDWEQIKNEAKLR